MPIVLEMVIIKGRATVIGRMTVLEMVTILGMVGFFGKVLVLRMVNVLVMVRMLFGSYCVKETLSVRQTVPYLELLHN